jgi:hypothetical protein
MGNKAMLGGIFFQTIIIAGYMSFAIDSIFHYLNNKSLQLPNKDPPTDSRILPLGTSFSSLAI